MPYIGASLHILVAIFFAIHAIRTRREMYWLMILFMFPLLGSVVYFFAIYLPESRIRSGVKKVTQVAMKTLDPGRELRDAEQAFALTPSAQNQMRFAAALLEAGQTHQAAQQYEACLQGPFANEREMLYGAARARFQNGDGAAALELLHKIRASDPKYRKESVSCLIAQTYASIGQNEEARNEFENAAQQFGSVEAHVEYAIWALSIGDKKTAMVQKNALDEMQKHWDKQHFAMHRNSLQRLELALEKSEKA